MSEALRGQVRRRAGRGRAGSGEDRCRRDGVGVGGVEVRRREGKFISLGFRWNWNGFFDVYCIQSF